MANVGEGDAESTRNTETSEPDEPEPEIHFEPVVQLPEVKVITEDEHEEVLYQSRAKLFRYDTNPDEPQWKERGVGDVKLLRNPDSGHYRILMRREKVGKVCCNHRILPSLELKPMTTSDRAWVWTANDFAEETLQMTIFAIRFKDENTAVAFRDQWDKIRSLTKTDASAQMVRTLLAVGTVLTPNKVIGFSSDDVTVSSEKEGKALAENLADKLEQVTLDKSEKSES